MFLVSFDEVHIICFDPLRIVQLTILSEGRYASNIGIPLLREIQWPICSGVCSKLKNSALLVAWGGDLSVL